MSLPPSPSGRLSYQQVHDKLIEYWAASDKEINLWAAAHGDPTPAGAPLQECTFSPALLNEFAPTLSPDDAIPYEVARRLLIERLQTQDAEILAWVMWHGRPRIYKDDGGTLRARRVWHLLTLYPFDDSSPTIYARLIPYLFSRAEITGFDPAADWVQRAGFVDNPSGRYFSLAQVAKFLEQDAPADHVREQIEWAFTSGRWEAPDVSPANEATALPQLLEALKSRITLPELEILKFRRERFGIEFGRPDEISNQLGEKSDEGQSVALVDAAQSAVETKKAAFNDCFPKASMSRNDWGRVLKRALPRFILEYGCPADDLKAIRNLFDWLGGFDRIVKNKVTQGKHQDEPALILDDDPSLALTLSLLKKRLRRWRGI